MYDCQSKIEIQRDIEIEREWVREISGCGHWDREKDGKREKDRWWVERVNTRKWGILTHWGQNKMVAIWQTTFSSAFLNDNVWFAIKILFLGFQLTILQQWFIQWLGTKKTTRHYLNQWWPSSLTHIGVTLPQWVKKANELGPMSSNVANRSAL